jgi:uncharacterized protein (DUF433 family)
MRALELLERIEIHPEVMLGKPVVRGTRTNVEILLEKLAAGATIEEILADYPDLERDDVLAALAYAYHQGVFSSAGVERALGFASRFDVASFLKEAGISTAYDEADLEADRRTWNELRQA